MNKFKLFSLRKQHGQLHTLYAVGGWKGEGEKREIMVHRLGENIKKTFYVVISEATGSRVKSFVR